MTATAALRTTRADNRRAKVGSDGLTDAERVALGARYSHEQELTDADRQAFADFLKRKRAA